MLAAASPRVRPNSIALARIFNVGHLQWALERQVRKIAREYLEKYAASLSGGHR